MSEQRHEVIVVGAGLAGLSLARWLQRRGILATVLEKSRGVGGRCATRRVEEQPVDHGLPLLHGESRLFRKEVAGLREANLITDWPFHVHGLGTPCQPQGYDSRSRRWAIAEGVNALPRSLAREVDLLDGTLVERLVADGPRLKVMADGGIAHTAPTVVLTCPVPQTLELLAGLTDGAGEELHGVVTMLQRVQMVSSLVVLLGYERPTATDWHLRLPGPRSAIHSLINDSSKRGQGARQTLVLQGSPSYSRRELQSEPEQWAEGLLQAAVDELGPWVRKHAWTQTHRWRHARVQRGDELSHPVLLRLSGGATLGLCGEAFNPRGGAEGAFLSGIELAGRLLAGNATLNGRVQE